MNRWLVGWAGSLVLGLCSAVPVWAVPQLTGWQFNPGARQLAFVTTGPVQPRVQVVDNPLRVVIDLPGTDFAAPAESPISAGPVQRIRAGQADPQTARMVMELREGTPVPMPGQVTLRRPSPGFWLVQLPTGLPPAPGSLPSAQPSPLPTLPLPAPPAIRQVQVTGLETRGDGFLLRTSGPTRADARRLEELPPRIVVDVEDAELAVPPAARSVNTSQMGVMRLRIGQFQESPSITRTVLDLAPDNTRGDWEARYVGELGGILIRPAPIGSQPQIPAGLPVVLQSVQLTPQGLVLNSEQPLRIATNWENPNEFRLLLNPATLLANFVGPVLDPQSLIENLRIDQRDERTVIVLLQVPPGTRVGDPQILDTERRRILIPLVRSAPDSQQAVAPDSYDEPPNGNGRQIVLDAGHGGRDPGAQRGGIDESDLTLSIIRRLNTKLRRLNFKTTLSRRDDTYIPLAGRVNITNASGAELFVSVHINMMPNRDDIQGIETYYSHANSARLAYVLHRHLVEKTGKPDRRVRTRSLYVTRMNTVPAVLLEVGFISNDEERAQLSSPAYQELIADAIAEGLIEYLR